MKLYSYIVTDDTGFSPNPFWGCCTLACCKPAIRRTAEVGDWIVGLSPKASGNRIVFAMKVDEKLEFEDYFKDPRFVEKIPAFDKGKVIYKAGDNIYEPLANGGFRQLPSMHSNGELENPETKNHDLGELYVLIGHKFYYFGGDGPFLPECLNVLKVGRGHKCRFKKDPIPAFLGFIGLFSEGINSPPTQWPANDDSWRENRA